MANIESIKDALCDVRKAHRIIYAYQKRMMGIVRFIGKKLDFPVCVGYKWFSNEASKKISSSTWAWDFIYSYLFEYYLGVKKSPDGAMDYALSVVQYSDTGFFDSLQSTRTNLNSFSTEEESGSKFLFIIEAKPQASPWWWDTKAIINSKEFASCKHTSSIRHEGDSIIGLYSVPIELFMDEDSAISVLTDFCSFCHENKIADLLLY